MVKVKTKIKQSTKKLFDFIKDIYSPKRIFERFIKDIKDNKVYYAFAFAMMAFVCITKIGMMDFKGGDFFSTDIFNLVSGGLLDANDLIVDDTLLDSGKKLYDAVLPVGCALVVMYWLIDFAAVTVRDNFTPEIIARHFIKLLLAAIIMMKGWTIVESLCDLGASFVTVVENALDTPSESTPGDSNIVFKIMDVIALLIPWLMLALLGIVAAVVMKLKLITRAIKLVVFLGFAPVGLADLAGGSHSTSIRYAKNILALALQGAILMAINYGACEAASWFLTEGYDPSTSIGDLITAGALKVTGIESAAIALTAIGLYSKSEDMARTIVGL